MPVRQTQSHLRSLFAERGISPRHHLGQNFLIDLNIHKLIVDTAQVGPHDLILEVGPGTGALTTLMASRGAHIVAVEIDHGMARLAKEALAGMPNVHLIVADALANKNSLSPALVASLKEALTPLKHFKFVSNLPYNIATPMITNLLVDPVLSPALMVVTVQCELARRMTALPSTSAYGQLSVLTQTLADVSIIRTLPPSVFWPRPKVESAIVAIQPDPGRRHDLDTAWYHTIVRRVFLQRRKNLQHVLSSMWPNQWPKIEVQRWLQSLGFDGRVRAETLQVGQFLSLTRALKDRWGRNPASVYAVRENGDNRKAKHAEQGDMKSGRSPGAGN
jgi:16S rRNA (adenine1518-N6/adenine1519-N6)-dimethyltransferase